MNRRRNDNILIFNGIIYCWICYQFLYHIIYIECYQYHHYFSLFWILSIPLGFLFLLYPLNLFVSGIFYLFGPFDFIQQNSIYYVNSSEFTNHSPIKDVQYVTIHIPVYLETFVSTIKGTIQSAINCRDYYEMNPQYCIIVNILVSDDGLMVLYEKNKLDLYYERIRYYELNNIGYVARPVYNRIGRFKKASNMNFTYQVFFTMHKIIRLNSDISINPLQFILQLYKKYGIVIRANDLIYIGDFILLIDSDTRIPSNCLHETLSIFSMETKLAYSQHLIYPIITDINNQWEQFIAHFTQLIYERAIPLATAGGDCCPLVGHCAILRVQCLLCLLSIQHKNIWSELYVSEDFKLFMDLHGLGFYGKYITFTNQTNCLMNNFMEGITYQYIDELMKMKKYMYGACEILIYPIGKWWKCGIIHSNIYQYFYLKSIHLSAKLNLLAYLMTYMSIMFALPVSLMNIFLYQYYEGIMNLNSIKPLYIIAQVIFLFTFYATITNTTIVSRIEQIDCINYLWKNIYMLPYYTLFFGSLSYHFVKIFIHYLIQTANIQWGATNKDKTQNELKNTNWQRAITIIYELYDMYIFFMIILVLLFLNIYYQYIFHYNAIIPIWIITILHLVSPIYLTIISQ